MAGEALRSERASAQRQLDELETQSLAWEKAQQIKDD